MNTSSLRRTFLREGLCHHALDSPAKCNICLEALEEPVLHEPAPNEAEPTQSSNHAGCRIISCGHVFGDTCIRTWLQSANTCPLCRKVLFGTSWEVILVNFQRYQRDILETVRAQSARAEPQPDDEFRVFPDPARIQGHIGDMEETLEQLHQNQGTLGSIMEMSPERLEAMFADDSVLHVLEHCHRILETLQIQSVSRVMDTIPAASAQESVHPAAEGEHLSPTGPQSSGQETSGQVEPSETSTSDRMLRNPEMSAPSIPPETSEFGRLISEYTHARRVTGREILRRLRESNVMQDG